MGAALAELSVLGSKTQHSQVGYIGQGCGRLFGSKLRKLKLQTYQSISPAKVRMLHKREGPHLAISISRMPEPPPQATSENHLFW